MKPQGLDALTTKTMRPEALEAVVSIDAEQKRQAAGTDSPDQQQSQPQSAGPDTPSAPSTPFGERTDGTQSAAKLVEEVVQSVKSVVDQGLMWAEKKVDRLSSTEEHEITGPYTSLATCMPSDLDVIASGILPAVMRYDGNDEGAEKKGEEAQENDKGQDKEENEKEGDAEPKL